MVKHLAVTPVLWSCHQGVHAKKQRQHSVIINVIIDVIPALGASSSWDNERGVMGIIVCRGHHHRRCVEGHERQHHSRSLVIVVVVGSEGHHPCCQEASITIAGLHHYCSRGPLTIHGCCDRPVVIESSRSRRRCPLWSSASTVVLVAVSRGRCGH